MAGVVAGALVFREMGSPLWAAPCGQPTEMYPAGFLAGDSSSSSSAAEPSLRVQGSREPLASVLQTLVLPAAEFAGTALLSDCECKFGRHWFAQVLTQALRKRIHQKNVSATIASHSTASHSTASAAFRGDRNYIGDGGAQLQVLWCYCELLRVERDPKLPGPLHRKTAARPRALAAGTPARRGAGW